MIFAIAYDIKDLERESRFLRRMNELGTNIQYLPNSFFIQCEDTTATLLYNNLRELTDDVDRLLITQVNKTALMGWLNTTVVNWIKEHN